jgi:hypothetical protein
MHFGLHLIDIILWVSKCVFGVGCFCSRFLYKGYIFKICGKM